VLFILTSLENILIYPVGLKGNFFILNLVVHIVIVKGILLVITLDAGPLA